MKIIIFVFTACSGKTTFFKKSRSKYNSYFSKMDKNKCPFSKITCTLFLVFFCFLIHTEILDFINIILYCKANQCSQCIKN